MTMPFDYAAAIADARARWPAQCQPVRGLDPWAGFLRDQGGNVTSQNGEDGILAALFERIGAANRWCFEVGAADGILLSNTWALRQAGWYSVLIEQSPTLYRELSRNRGPGECCLNTRIGPLCPLDGALKHAGALDNIDLGVIDIDGQDVHVWRGLQKFRPRVMLVEYNPAGDGIQGGTTEWQAGLDTVVACGREKGYRPLLALQCNALFVDEGAIR